MGTRTLLGGLRRLEGWEACAASILDHADASGSAHLLLASLRHLGQFGPKTLMKAEGRVEEGGVWRILLPRRRAASWVDEGRRSARGYRQLFTRSCFSGMARA